MKQIRWLILSIFGLALLACTPGEALTTTRIAAVEATAVLPTTASPTIPPTWTTQPTITEPTPTITPTPNPWIPQYTPTFVPTPTEVVIPSPTPETVLLTPIESIVPGQSLPIDNELLFIENGRLRLWQPQLGQVKTILTPPNAKSAVTDWRVSADKQTILVVTSPTDDFFPGYTFSIFDVQSGEITEAWSETADYLLAYALSADGLSIAYTVSTTPIREEAGVETVKVINWQEGQPQTVADCPNYRLVDFGETIRGVNVHCTYLSAVPDGRTWLWRDVEGVWQGGLEQPPQLLITHKFFENDMPRIFSPSEDWSPNGRYQILYGQFFEGGGKERFVLDMTTAITTTLPNYDTSFDWHSEWLWTSDNHLAVIHQPLNEDQPNNVAELWHIAGSELVQDTVLPLPNVGWAAPVSLAELPDGRFAFVINHQDPLDAETRNIYLIHSFDQPPQPIISLPPAESFGAWESLTWLPDGSGMLYMSPHSDQTASTYYIPTDGDVLYELNALFNGYITNRLWLP